MPINPNIALSVKGLELQDPMNQFAKMAQIQNVQNQNAMAQYQLGAAQREDAVNNAMSQSYQRNFKNGVLDEDAVINDVAAAGGGSKIQGIRKGFDESRKAKTESQKAQIELGDAKLKQARGFLEGIDPTSPNAVARYKEWFAATQSDPVIQSVFKPTLEKLAASKGMSYEEFFPQYIQERAAEIEQASQDPQAFANLLNNSKLGTEKFIEMNKSTLTSQDTGDGGRIIARPGLGGPATVVEGSEFKKGISATDQARLANERIRINQDGARLALEREKAAREKDPEFQRKLAEAKSAGTEAAKNKSKFNQLMPGVVDKAEQALANIDALVGDSVLDKAGNLVIPEGGRKPHPGFGQAVGIGIPGLKYVPGTDTADFENRLKQVQGGAFLEAFESLKGGGAITEQEGKKATEAINRMNSSTSEKEFVTAAREFQNVIRRGVANIQAKSGNAGSSVPTDIADILKMYPGK